MTLTQLNLNPTDKQLKQFSLSTTFILPFGGWMLSRWPGLVRQWTESDTTFIAILFGVGLLFCLIGFLRPQVLKPLFVALSVIGYPIGLIVGEIALFVLYYGLFVPIGLLFHLFGRDSLRLKQDKTSNSYWINIAKQPESGEDQVESYFHQS